MEEGKYVIIYNIWEWFSELGHFYTVNRYSDVRIDLKEIKEGEPIWKALTKHGIIK